MAEKVSIIPIKCPDDGDTLNTEQRCDWCGGFICQSCGEWFGEHAEREPNPVDPIGEWCMDCMKEWADSQDAWEALRRQPLN